MASVTEAVPLAPALVRWRYHEGAGDPRLGFHMLIVAVAAAFHAEPHRFSSKAIARRPPARLLPLPRRGSGNGSLESIAYRAHSARTAEPVQLAANA